MRAMVLYSPGQPLQCEERPIPTPTAQQLLLRVLACGVCRTDLHLFDGELPQAVLPRVPGHEIVGEVIAAGADVAAEWIGRRVGVPWLGWTCGECVFCRSGRENLCDQAQFTGCQLDGGYAEYTVADQRFCFAIPDTLSDIQAAPLLCAGLIGFRALQMAQGAQHLGCTDLARRHIWQFRLPAVAGNRSTPLPERMTTKARPMHAPSAPNGPGLRISHHPMRWTPA